MAYLSGSAQPQNVVRVTLLIPGREFRGTFTSTIALASYAGFYRSAELDTTYKLSVEQGNLITGYELEIPRSSSSRSFLTSLALLT